MQPISSRQNPLVRAFRDLARNPDSTGTRVLLDGVHLIREARAAGMAFEAVALERSHSSAATEEAATEEAAVARRLEDEGVQLLSVGEQVFAVMSPVRAPSGIVAIATRRETRAEDVCRTASAFVLMAVDVQDPGNLGALIRTGEAGGATGVLVCGASASPFSWKAVRGSMGSVLRLPVAAGLTLDAAVACMKSHGARLVAAVPRGGDDPDALDWRGRVGLLLGGEGPGLTDAALAGADARVTIPMAEPVESLNVAACAAILVYAARRQRGL